MTDRPPIDVDQAAEPESDGQIRSGKLAGKTLWQAIWIVALPVLIHQTLGAFVGLVDKMLAGGLPADMVVESMDGMGIGSYVGWLIAIAMTGLGIGGQALIARAIGAGDTRQAGQALGQALTLGVLWSVVVAVVMYLAAAPLAWVCGLDGAAAEACVVYVRMMTWALPGTAIMMVGAMCLQGAGETLWPAIIGVLVNIVNVVCSWLLSGATITIAGSAFTSPLGFDWHVEGIAAGTAVGWLVGGATTLWVVLRGVKDLKLRRSDVPIERSMSWRVVRIGLPNFFEGMSMWSANLVCLWIIGLVAAAAAATGTLWTLNGVVDTSLGGDGLVGAHVIAIQWESFSFLPGFAIGTAAAAIAGQYMGAGNERMARKAVYTCAGAGLAVMGVLGIVFMCFGETFTRIVSDEPVFLALVPDLLIVCGVMQVAFAVSMVVRQALRGLGDTMWVFWITTGSSYGIRLPMAWFFGLHLGWGLTGVWIGLCGEMLFRALFFLARFRFGGWAAKQL
ncbi:MAG: MATE family efflux transporter [Phycisphaerales bacterium]|nr:MATE family efflux transporter [Phycisphaerales bacterium]